VEGWGEGWAIAEKNSYTAKTVENKIVQEETFRVPENYPPRPPSKK